MWTYVSLQAQVVGDVRDLLGVGFGALDEVRLQGGTHGSFQTCPPLPFPGVDKHSLDLVHLRKRENHMSKDARVERASVRAKAA